MAGIYLHIPFCKQACSYCDFYFVTRRALREPFTRQLSREIESAAGTRFTEQPIETIYFGGGTPSLLRLEELDQILTSIESTFALDLQEVTIELNPDDVTFEYLEGLKRLGIHRASMGIQSFDSARLKTMNRAHTADEATRALELLSETGFDSCNVDLIYGQPGQSDSSLEFDLDELLRFNPPHVSAYTLTIEPGTRLGREVERGRTVPLAEEQVAAQFDIVSARLDEAGIRRYEVSNFSRPGREALHNRRYWSHENYLGFGPSAHSFWWAESRIVRWEHSRDIRSYLSAPPDWQQLETSLTEPVPDSDMPVGAEALNLEQLAEESVMLGLRTIWGTNRRLLKERYDYPLTTEQIEWLDKKEKEGLVRVESETIRLTESGLRIADYLILELLRRKH